MKKLIVILTLLGSLYADDVVKGQTYYLYTLKDALGYNGAVFSKQHTQKEWKKLFQNDAKGLKAKLINEKPELSNFVNSEKFKKIAPFLKAFTLHYAKDVKNSPTCN